MTGVYCLEPSIFEMIEKLKPSWRGELEITEAIQKLIESPDHKVEYHLGIFARRNRRLLNQSNKLGIRIEPINYA